jgi:DNA-binding NarL/FixJ family response regulator
MERTKVLLADDHTVVRAGLKAMIDAQPDMVVVGEAIDGIETLALVEEASPNLLVLDLSMPLLNGLEVAQRLRVRDSEPRILILSVHEDATYLCRALEAGAAGYVLKRAAAESLIGAIREVSGGGIYIDPALGPAVAQSVVGAGKPTSVAANLSEREDAVLRLIAQGYSNKEIAARLDLSVKTVETYKARAMEKLGLTGRVDIVRYATAHGWLGAV